MTRYIVGFLVAVGLIVVVIILIVRGLVSGPSSSPSTQLNLKDYADTSTVVRLTLDTPVTATETHHDVVMTVGNLESTLEVTKGYDGEVVRQKSYPMSSNAYAVFLRALSIYGFTKGDNDTKVADERGQCALGDRYIFEVVDPTGNSLQRYWYSSCGVGTFQGNNNAIRTLFIKQFPDYFSLVRDVQF